MANQINILIQAYKYLTQLNRNIDPLSAQKLPSSCAAYEETIHSSMYFSSRALAFMIIRDSPVERPTFFITPEQQAKLRPKSESVTIEELVQHINYAVDILQCRGISKLRFMDWLEETGYLQRTGTRRAPSASGQSIGIQLLASGQFLRYSLTPDAQQFIIDHLQDFSQYAQAHSSKDSKKKAKITDPEALQHHLRYMELLSQGRNPVTDTPLSPQDPLNQERLRKCFAFTAEVMGRSLDTGYFTAKVPFTLPREQWKDIPISQEAISLWGFLTEINSLRQDPTAIQALSYSLFLKYLISQGLFQKLPEEKDGKTYYYSRPTPAGNLMGFGTMEVPDDLKGSHTVLSCDAKAQQYLVDHLAEFISLAAEEWRKS